MRDTAVSIALTGPGAMNDFSGVRRHVEHGKEGKHANSNLVLRNTSIVCEVEKQLSSVAVCRADNSCT